MNSWGSSKAVLLVAVAVACRTPEDIQRDYAQTLMPRSFDRETAARAPSTGPRVMRVRVYADLDYQAQVLRWEQRFNRQLASANQVLSAQLDVTLEVESFLTWERRSTQGSLDEALQALTQLDDGDDVDWVVGLCSALTVFSSSHHQLGEATLFGRHLVLRAMENAEEASALQASLDKLPTGELEHLYLARKVHKEQSVLLHELGHTLGAFHITTPGFLMAPSYDEKQSRFPGPVLRLLHLGLQHHRGAVKPEVRQAWGAAYLQAVEAHPWELFNRSEQEDALRIARELMEGRGAVAEAREPTLPTFERSADVDDYNRVVSLANSGRVDQALSALEALQRRVPDHPAVLELKCLLWSRKAESGLETVSHCQRAATAGGRVRVWLALSQAQRLSGDEEAGRRALGEARARLERAGAQDEGSLWSVFADLASGLGQLTWVEQAAARLSSEVRAELLARASHQRRWLGLPADASALGLTGVQEGHFVAEARAAHRLLARAEWSALSQVVRTLETSAPRLPGTLGLRCALEAHARRAAKARQACLAALAVQGDHLLAHLMLAGLSSGREAVEHLSEVVSGDPSYAPAYPLLAEACRRAGDRRRLDEVRAAYRRQFARDL